MNTPPPTPTPIITSEFFREGIWAAVHDNYDHSSYSVGPFPSHEAACVYCEAYNRNEVLELWTRLSREQIAERFCDEIDKRYTPTHRPFTKGHSADAFLETLLYHTIDRARSTWQPLTKDLALVLFSWSEADVNPDAVAEKYGAKLEYEWRNIQSEQRKNRIRCWCDDLRKNIVPHKKDLREDEPYLDWLDPNVREWIKNSPQGTAWYKRRCRICSSEVWQLRLEGRYSDVFSWYTVPAKRQRLRRAEKTLTPENIEEWFEGRAGIYVFGEPQFYTSTIITML